MKTVYMLTFAWAEYTPEENISGVFATAQAAHDEANRLWRDMHAGERYTLEEWEENKWHEGSEYFITALRVYE